MRQFFRSILTALSIACLAASFGSYGLLRKTAAQTAYEAIPNAEYVGYQVEEFEPVAVDNVVVADDDEEAKEPAGVFQIPRRNS